MDAMMRRCIAWALCLGGLTSTAQAVPTLVMSRADLGATDYLQWPTSGVPATDPFQRLSGAGMTVNVSSSADGFLAFREQGTPGWQGNFAHGDGVLSYTALFGHAPITLEFPMAVQGGGAQIQRSAPGSFMATISAFDLSGALMQSFELAGTATTAGDGSALFIGIRDSAASIGRIQLGLVSGGDFGINRFDFLPAAIASGSPLPEPGSTALFAAALGGILVVRRRQRLAQGAGTVRGDGLQTQ